MNDFRRLLAAEAVSNFGSMLNRVAFPWIAALLLDATPFGMGLLLGVARGSQEPPRLVVLRHEQPAPRGGHGDAGD